MPIEFDCPQCHHRLRVPDGSEGRAAICPQCSQQVAIPADSSPAAPEGNTPESSMPEGGAPSEPSTQTPDSGSFNPYASPSASTESPQTFSSTDLTPTKVSVSDIFGTTWRIFRANLLQFVLLGAILMAMYIGGSIVSAPLSFISGMAAEQENIPLVIGVNLLSIVWGQIYGAFCIAVGMRYTLDVVAGVKEPFNNAFKVWPFYWRILIAQIICALLASFGAGISLIPIAPVIAFSSGSPEILIPAIIVGILLAMLVYIAIMARVGVTIPFIIDRNQGVSEALSNSIAYTKGNTVAIVATFFLTWIGMIFFIVFTCFLGSILAMPFGLTMGVVIYRLVTGQTIPNEASPFPPPAAT